QGRHRGIEALDFKSFDSGGLGRSAGIVEQAINTTEFIDGLVDQLTDVVFDRDVGATKQAGGTELFRKRLAFRGPAAGDDDPGAFGDEYLRGAQPDPTRRASDHRN